MFNETCPIPFFPFCSHVLGNGVEGEEIQHREQYLVSYTQESLKTDSITRQEKMMVT
jgi:hypothetical protein